MSPPTLYGAPDNASLIVRSVLHHLDAPYHYVPVDRAGREQDSPAYRALNPNGLIPVLILDGSPLFETGAILLTLAERHSSLAPAPGTADRAGFLKWMVYISNSLHVDLQALFYPAKLVGHDRDAQNNLGRHVRDRLHRRFALIEAQVVQNPAGYLVGNALTVADFYLAFCLRWAQLYPSDTPAVFAPSAYPGLAAYLSRLQDIPGILEAAARDGIAAPVLNPASEVSGVAGSPT